MEDQRDDLVVILAGYADKMDKFFRSNPGFRSRVAHHIDFPDYSDEELYEIALKMLAEQNYSLSKNAEGILKEYIAKRRKQPHFANARSIRNGLDRTILRQANRLFKKGDVELTAKELSEIDYEDIAASRVFQGQAEEDIPVKKQA